MRFKCKGERRRCVGIININQDYDVKTFPCSMFQKINILWFNISIVFISYTYTQNSLQFNSPFSTHNSSCHPISNIYKPKNYVIYLRSSNNTYLALTLLFHLILTCMSWLQPRKWGLHFILSDNSNYDFDIKVRRYGFVGFINDEIDCGVWDVYFVLELKRKWKTH